jgi:methyl-accepting chemotaxis protein
MSFRRSAPAVLIAVSVVVLIATGIASNRMSSGLIASVEESRFQLMRSILVNSLGDAESKALARAEMIASLPNVQHLLRTADREAMFDETGRMFEIQRDRFGVDQAQFFVPPSVSFLRINAPDKFGDDVASFRPTVVEAFKTGESIKGLSISRSGPAVFGIAPVRDDLGDIGFVEFGLDFAAVLDGLKARYGLDCALFMEEKPLREIATGMGGDVLTDENRIGKYMRIHTTHLDRMKELVADRDIMSGERTYVRDAAGVPHGVLVLPAKNYAGKQIGVIVVAADFSGSRGASSETMVWQALLALFGIVLSAGAILIVIRGMIVLPMREVANKLAAVAAGDRTEEVAGVDDMCDEMKDIARSVEVLRSKTEGEP